ncbi:hypothetical protein MKY34_19750 [Sporosarcina sp. FSL K6-1522]|uniref:hypothetical protein n=1 Tax=Sporosarcina sp. FSL K6-1522 TaxID=2921554 RepID=UPI00315A3AA8
MKDAEQLERIKRGSITGSDIPFIVKEFERLEELERINSVMDDNLVGAGREIIRKENERAELQWQIDRLRAVLETIMQMEQPEKRSNTGKHNDILLIKRLAKDALREPE